MATTDKTKDLLLHAILNDPERPVVYCNYTRRYIRRKDMPPPPCDSCGGDLEWRHQDWPKRGELCRSCCGAKSWQAMPMRFRLVNKHGRCPANAKAIVRATLFTIYEFIANAGTVSMEKMQMRYPLHRCLTNTPHQRGCTIRLLSGREICITENTLRILTTFRKFYQYVRNILELEKHISLYLRFEQHEGYRAFESPRQWTEHEVPCGDAHCHRYLKGSMLLAIVHP